MRALTKDLGRLVYKVETEPLPTANIRRGGANGGARRTAQLGTRRRGASLSREPADPRHGLRAGGPGGRSRAAVRGVGPALSRFGSRYAAASGNSPLVAGGRMTEWGTDREGLRVPRPAGEQGNFLLRTRRRG